MIVSPEFPIAIDLAYNMVLTVVDTNSVEKNTPFSSGEYNLANTQTCLFHKLTWAAVCACVRVCVCVYVCEVLLKDICRSNSFWQQQDTVVTMSKEHLKNVKTICKEINSHKNLMQKWISSFSNATSTVKDKEVLLPQFYHYRLQWTSLKLEVMNNSEDLNTNLLKRN